MKKEEYFAWSLRLRDAGKRTAESDGRAICDLAWGQGARITEQGAAGKLMEEAAAQLRRDHKKAILTCSYAAQWFEKNPEYDDVVQR